MFKHSFHLKNTSLFCWVAFSFVALVTVFNKGYNDIDVLCVKVLLDDFVSPSYLDCIHLIFHI